MTGRSRHASPLQETGGHGLKAAGADRVEMCARELLRRNVGVDGSTVTAFEQICRVEPRPRLCQGHGRLIFQKEAAMKLYNSATHMKEEFVPNHPDIVKMYTCGPTVYHFAHIGNMRSYMMEDILEK